MKKAMTAIIACFFCMTCHAATEKRGDVVNFSLGKYGCTPNLDNSMVSANLAPSAMIDKSCINFQYNNSYFLPQIGFSDIIQQVFLFPNFSRLGSLSTLPVNTADFIYRKKKV